MASREIFDKVKAHLLEQNCTATNSDGDCMYRGANGTKCAVGFLIDDQVYYKDLEGNSIHDTIVQEAVAESGYDLTDGNVCIMLAQLQQMHDTTPAEDWPEALRRIEISYFGEV